jgi:lysophospholipase L1-like esterase
MMLMTKKTTTNKDRVKWTASALCLTFVGLLISCHSAWSGSVMPLGDSATLGAYSANDFGVGGYRAPLWSRLTQEGYAVDFVGSVNGPAPGGVDSNHEGHGGWRIDDLAGSIDGWLATYRPDIILLMAGGNDIIQGYGVNTAMSRMDTLLGKIFTDRPNAVVLLGSLWWVPTPNFYNYDINQIKDMNNRLPALVAKYAQQGRAIELVDQYNLGWGVTNFGVDQIHPNASGYAKMAQAWHDPLAHRLVASPGNFCAGGVDCHGNPVTTGNGVCGPDLKTYDCTASGWRGPIQSCVCGGAQPPGNFCAGGVDCHGNAVTTGSGVCGTDLKTYDCTASGWQGPKQSCVCGH